MSVESIGFDASDSQLEEGGSTPSLRSTLFNTLLIDCPWSYTDKKTGGTFKSGAVQKYPTLSLEDICALDVSKITESDCILFLWITNPLLFSHAPKVLSSWGFKYRTLLTWKKKSFGLGHWMRGCTEHLIVATKGNVKPFRYQKRNFLETKGLKHSQKPEEVRTMIDEIADKVFGSRARKLEMFARVWSPGWDSWGIDIDGKTIQQKIDEYCPQKPTQGLIIDEVTNV